MPGFENSYIVDIAPQVGIRETRRVRGRYLLTEADVLECASFDDTVGVNGWPLELHLKSDVEFRWPKIPGKPRLQPSALPDDRPARAWTNLWVAGRCASMSHEAQSAARVTGACFVMGQAAGTAACLALANTAAARLPSMRRALQTRLESAGAYLGLSW